MFVCLENKNNVTKDFILITAPYTDSLLPLMAPAALKPVIEAQGLSCLAADLNAEIFDFTKKNKFHKEFLNFFFDGRTSDEAAIILETMFSGVAEQISSFKPKYVGISLLSYVCQISTEWLCYFLKKTLPEVQIIIGGAGCVSSFTGSLSYVDKLKSENLIDYHILGDGEHSLAELLKGNTSYPGINSNNWRELNNKEINLLPLPNYDDYNFSFYDKKIIALQGSRGCVRKCTFCDVIENWKNFTWRSASNIFNEMITQYKKYKIRDFKFQDSLINGNQKEFQTLLELLVEWNKKNPDKSFNWSSYFIFREITKSSTTEWKLIAQSGAKVLVVGIENLNQHIRYAIGKKFSDESIIFHLEQAKKYNIKIQMLNIVGYINETQDDINNIKKWLKDNLRFKDILIIQWGGTLGIFPNTYLDRNKHNLGITMIGDKPPLWINKEINSTPSLRASWAKELKEFSESLGYECNNDLDNHYVLEMLMQQHHG
jgi:hypothetical protein